MVNGEGEECGEGCSRQHRRWSGDPGGGYAPSRKNANYMQKRLNLVRILCTFVI